MLQVYKHSNGHLEDDISLATAEKGSWINIINPDSEDLQLVSMIAEIPTDVLKTPLDTEERSHVELEDNYIFVVINIPVLRGTDSYDALPLGGHEVHAEDRHRGPRDRHRRRDVTERDV